MDAEEKRKADLARKAENARLLAEEESSTTVKKAAPKAQKKASSSKPAGPGALAAGGGLASISADSGPSEAGSSKRPEDDAPVESFAATGIDNALDMLEVVNAKTDKASVGQQAAGLERHPEVYIITFRVVVH